MKKLKALFLTALMIGMISTYTSAPAQNSPETQATADERSDDDTNYGWIGLLGLIGLAGLVKRNKDVRYGSEANSPKYTIN